MTSSLAPRRSRWTAGAAAALCAGSLCAIPAPSSHARTLPPGLASVDLATAAVPRFDGARAGDALEIAASGDFDGDGAADLALASPTAEGGRGAVYVLFGAPGRQIASRDLATTPADVTIVGAFAGSGLGASIAAVDLDADGASELVASVLAARAPYTRLQSGGALIFRGGAAFRGRTRVDLGLDSGDAVVVDSRIALPVFGALASGDLDDDGYPDLAVGSTRSPGSAGERNAGQVAVLFGAQDFPQGEVFDLAAPSDARTAVVTGRGAEDNLGSDLAFGDFSGDHVDDLVLGAPARKGTRTGAGVKSGELYVVAGETLGRGDRLELATDQVYFRAISADEGDFLGNNVSVADVDADGTGDVVTTLIGGDGIGNARQHDCGEVFAWFGDAARASGATFDDLVDQPSLWVIGDEPLRFLGRSLAAGDTDGDRRAEIVASIDRVDGPNGRAGAIVIVRPTPPVFDLANATNTTIVYGALSNDDLGKTIRMADLDADGTKDVIVSAPSARFVRGSVYVLPGARSTANAAPAISAVPDQTVRVGATLRIQLAATDADGDYVRLEVLGRPDGATFERKGSGAAELLFAPTQVGSWTVTLRASDGQQSVVRTFTVSATESGERPRVTSAKYRGGKLRIDGEGFGPGANVRINGTPVALPAAYKPARGRLLVKGTREALGLDAAPGANSVVVTTADGATSDAFAF